MKTFSLIEVFGEVPVDPEEFKKLDLNLSGLESVTGANFCY